MKDIQQPDENENQLILSEKVLHFFKISSRWGSFISIFSVGIIVFFFTFYYYFLTLIWNKSGITISSLFSTMEPKTGLLLFFGFLIFSIHILACISLWQFSSQMKKASLLKSSKIMEGAMTELMKFFRYNVIIGMLILTLFLMSYLDFYPNPVN